MPRAIASNIVSIWAFRRPKHRENSRSVDGPQTLFSASRFVFCRFRFVSRWSSLLSSSVVLFLSMPIPPPPPSPLYNSDNTDSEWQHDAVRPTMTRRT
jgi:hypothetical protein